ncbi:MAG: hypothetical protein ACYDCO_05100 [Armatimonadota bacterium]
MKWLSCILVVLGLGCLLLGSGCKKAATNAAPPGPAAGSRPGSSSASSPEIPLDPAAADGASTVTPAEPDMSADPSETPYGKAPKPGVHLPD